MTGRPVEPGQSNRNLADAILAAGDRGSAPRIPKRSPTEPVPLLSIQERIWFIQEAHPDSAAYNIPTAFEIHGTLDADRLQTALNLLIARHELLRSRFVHRDGRVWAEVEDFLSVPIAAGEMTADPSEWKAALDEASSFKFNLSTPGQLRAWLWKIDADRHVFLLNVHHVLVEARGLSVLCDELGQIYADLATDSLVSLEPPLVGFWDFTSWEGADVDASRLEKMTTRSKNRLGEIEADLELSSTRDSQSYDPRPGSILRRALPQGLVEKIEALARNNRATPFHVLLAAYYILVYKQTGTEDFYVGTPVSTRIDAETQEMIGIFLNTMILRSHVTQESSFGDVLKAVRRDTMEAFATMDVPMEVLLQELQRGKSLRQRSLFDTVFSLQNAGANTFSLGQGMSADLLPLTEVRSGEVKVDLALIVEPAAGDWTILAEYAHEAFSAERMERLLAEYEHLLEEICRTPAARVEEIAAIPAPELHRILVEVNETGDGLVSEESAIQQVWAMARTQPDAEAVVMGQVVVTYGELLASATQVAHQLRSRSLARQDVVAVCMRRSPEVIAAILGTHLAGCAYLPLDPEHPDARLEFMLVDSASRVLLTDDPNRFKSMNVGISVLDPGEEVDPEQVDPEEVDFIGSVDFNVDWPLEEELAYVVYTSGSSGKPKGVMIEHRGLTNLVSWHASYYGLSSSDRSSMLAGLGFDASVCELWPYLASGATLVLASDETRLDPKALANWLKEHRVTVCFLPTPLGEALLELDVSEELGLRVLLVAGDTLHARRGGKWPFSIHNNYGPTENSVCSTAGPVSFDQDRGRNPDIGRPILNHRVYVLDSARNPVPLGCRGELYLSGPGLARGYLGRPEETAEKFVVNPFGSGPFAKMYRTGDLARILESGALEFLGRADDQVKVRGLRVELGEIESTLTSQVGVREAVVIAALRDPAGMQLIAFVTPTEGAGLNLAKLEDTLRKSLPAQMVPTQLVELAQLPLTVNGKVDRKDLEKRAAAVVPAPRRGDPPATDMELLVARVWKEVLTDVAELGCADNFLHLGGHSLLAVQVVSRLEDETGVRINPIHLLMDDLASVARVIDQARPVKEASVPGSGGADFSSNGLVEDSGGLVEDFGDLPKGASGVWNALHRLFGGSRNKDHTS